MTNETTIPAAAAQTLTLSDAARATHRAFLLRFVVASLALGAAYADTVSVNAQVSVLPLLGSDYPACSNSETLSAGTATASCDSGLVSASASYTGTGSSLFSGTATVEGGTSSAYAVGLASITDSLSEYLIVTGDTGTGTLTLDFLLSGEGGEFGSETGSTLELGTNFGDFYNPLPLCSGDAPCEWNASGNAETITIPFTFGVPFLFTEDFEMTASGTNGTASTIGQISANGFSVVDSNGNPVPGAQLIATPEPGSFGLVLSFLALLWFWHRSQNTRAGWASLPDEYGGGSLNGEIRRKQGVSKSKAEFIQ